jgi:hypothetical protein
VESLAQWYELRLLQEQPRRYTEGLEKQGCEESVRGR